MSELQRKLTTIAVAAVAMIDHQRHVLLQRRPLGSAYAGLWEFPGGKLEAGESRKTAAVRELAEELGVVLDVADLLWAGRATTAPGIEPAVVIDLYMTRHWSGAPMPCDGAAIEWYRPDELAALAMPPLDYPLAQALLRALHSADSKSG